MAMLGTPDTLTPREYETMQYEKEMFEKQSAHQLAIAQIEARWSAWFRIPSLIIKLPVLILFAIAYICSVLVKKEMPAAFWDFMK